MGLFSKEAKSTIVKFIADKGLLLVDTAIAAELTKILGKPVSVSTVRRVRKELGIIKKARKIKPNPEPTNRKSTDDIND